MDFDINESPPYSSPSSSSSPSLIILPRKPMTPPPNPNPSLSSSQPHDLMMSSSSHKRKAGRKKFKETRHPVYRGVRRRNGNKWVCEIREPHKKSRIWLGTYPTAEMAARAHDVAVLTLKGTSASFNFPDSPLVLPLARSSSPTHIREAAAKAAKAFKPNIASSSSSSSSSPSLLSNSSSSTSPNDFCGETIRLDSGQERRELGSCLKINNVHYCVEGDELNVGNDNNEGSKTMFLDEEALYNMPGLLDSMAEGMLITPPSMKKALDWDDIGCELIDLNLWAD